MEISHSKRHLAHMIAEEPSAEREVHLQSALKHAKTSVLICEQYNLRKDLPLCHYEVGRTLIDLRRFEEAKEHLKLSYPQNLKRAGGFALADLVALAEIAHEQHDYEELERLVEEVKDDSKAKSLQVGKRADAELFKGRLLRLYAQAQFEQGQYKAALHSYVEALKRIARHGGYGAYNLDYELEQLMDYITQLPDEIKASWCNRFIEKWTVSDVDDKRSELVINTVHLAKTISH
jgi:tetratricopeptide (TPR) repeat protein